MTHEEYALLGLSVTLLGIIITSTWKFSALATKLADSITSLEKKDLELERKISIVESVPELKTKLEYLEKNHSLIPSVLSRVVTLETQAQHSKEMRKVLLRQSRPDKEEDE
jgi:hypothetical protein